MAEMRGFLESVQKINEGIAKNDPEIIAKVGQQSGTCKVDAVPQGLVKSLPFEFKQMGFQTHELFDVMAKMAKEIRPPTNSGKAQSIAQQLCCLS
jgi:hypothetical protein